MQNNKEINEIFEEPKKNEKIIKYFFYDYFYLYCLESQDKYKDIKKSQLSFLELFLQINFCDSKEIKDTFIEAFNKLDIYFFSEIIIFLESYKNEIMPLLQVNYLLNSFFPELLDSLKKLTIMDKRQDNQSEDINDIDNDLQNEKKEKFDKINHVFNKIIDCFIMSLFENKKEIGDFQKNFKSFYETLNYIEIILNQINKKFSLNNFNLDLLDYLLFIFNIIKNLDVPENEIIEIIDLIKQDNYYLKSKEYDKSFDLMMKLKDKIIALYKEDSEELNNHIFNMLRRAFIKINDDNNK